MCDVGVPQAMKGNLWHVHLCDEPGERLCEISGAARAYGPILADTQKHKIVVTWANAQLEKPLGLAVAVTL